MIPLHITHHEMTLAFVVLFAITVLFTYGFYRIGVFGSSATEVTHDG